MINASAAENLRAFLAFCLLGAALGLLWSVLRGVRAHLSKKSALAVFLDAAFCVLAAFAVELCALSTYWGQVRAFHLFGAAAGFAAAASTLGRGVTAVVRGVLSLLLRLGRPIAGFFLRKGRAFGRFAAKKAANRLHSSRCIIKALLPVLKNGPAKSQQGRR